MSGRAVLARVLRSGVEESVHLGHVAVCDADGKLLSSGGDPDRVVFARSSLKPLQASVSLDLIGEDLPDDEVAVMCGSHNGEPVHVRAVRSILARGDMHDDVLQCPAAWPLHPEDARAFERPQPILHNCSGKHAGMLLASVRAGLALDRYLDPDHPVQRAVADALVRFAGEEPEAVGVDGCGAPAPAVPLRAMATLFARLAAPASPDALGAQVGRAASAMRASPYLVAGRDRADTVLMQHVAGIVVKSGAEGLACAGVLNDGIGVAVRVDDGAGRAAGPALVRALQLLRVVDENPEDPIRRIARPDVTGGGRPVGALTSDFVLKSA